MPSSGLNGFTVVPGDCGLLFPPDDSSPTPTPGGKVIWLPVGTAGTTIAPGAVVGTGKSAFFGTVVVALADFAFFFVDLFAFLAGALLVFGVELAGEVGAGASALLSLDPPPHAAATVKSAAAQIANPTRNLRRSAIEADGTRRPEFGQDTARVAALGVMSHR